jgi:hypothetical protein
VLIFVIGLFHGMPIFVLLAWNDKKTWSGGFLGSARVPRAGERVLAIADFSFTFHNPQ